MMLVAQLEPLATVIVSTADVTFDTSLIRAYAFNMHRDLVIGLPRQSKRRQESDQNLRRRAMRI